MLIFFYPQVLGEKVDTFPKKSINPKVNVIAGVDLEILYYDVQV